MAGNFYRDQLKEKRRRKFLFKLFLITGLVFLCAGGAIYLLFFANLLDLRSISISGAETIPDADIRAVVQTWTDKSFLGIPRSKDVLFVSSGKLSAQILAQFPRIDSVEITKEFPHGMSLAIRERYPAGIWCSGPLSCFYFDQTGIAYAQTAPSSGFLISSVIDYRASGSVELGLRVASDAWLQNILKAKELLTRLGISVAEFSIPANSFDEFEAKTSQGWKILFSNSTDVPKQLSSLGVLFKDKLSAAKREGLQYIDLRVQDRIYYK